MNSTFKYIKESHKFGILFPLFHSYLFLQVSESPKCRKRHASNLELKIQKQYLHLHFSKLFWLISTALLRILSKLRNSRYLTVIALNSFMKVSKKPNNTGVLNLTFQLKIQKQGSHVAFFCPITNHIGTTFENTQCNNKFSISHPQYTSQ